MMRTLWRWHAAEETEHRAVAFDVYQAVGGGWLRRTGWFAYVLLMFSMEAALQTAGNLWRDGTLLRLRTARSALAFFFGRDGAIWRCALPLLAYFAPGFHPARETHAPPAESLARQWLADNAAQWRPVR